MTEEEKKLLLEAIPPIYVCNITEIQEKKIEEIINSYIEYNGKTTILCLSLPYKDEVIEIAISLAKEVFNKDITEEEAIKIFGYDGYIPMTSLPMSMPIKYVFWIMAYMLDRHFTLTNLENNSIKE